MRVLALDTALGATAAGIVEFPSCGVLGSRALPMERGHAEALLPMVRDIMAQTGVGWSGIDRIVTTVGPGSFTGLRVGVAAARAFALARTLPVVGVSTLTAYAAPLLAGGSRTSIAVAIDARHGAVFFECFWNDGRVSSPPALMPLEAAAAILKSGRTRLVGNAAPQLFAAAQSLGCDCEIADAAPAPRIEWIARLGAAADPVTAPALPLYLRAASAVPQPGSAIARASA